MVSRLMKLLMMSCILFYLLLLFSGFDAEYGPEMAGERAMNERKDKRRNDRQERIQPALPERAVYQILLLQEGRVERYGDDSSNDQRAHRLFLGGALCHDNSSLD